MIAARPRRRRAASSAMLLAAAAVLSVPAVSSGAISSAFTSSGAISSAFYGYAGCIGVPPHTTTAELRTRGCTVLDDNSTNVPGTLGIAIPCRRRMPAWLDGMPLTFTRPIVASTLDAAGFEVTLSNGSKTTPLCTLLTPANERNEDHTPHLLGTFGDGLRGTVYPTAVRVVGSLELELGNGSRIDARGELYDNRTAVARAEMRYLNSTVRMVRAQAELFSTGGETKLGLPPGRYPNHCRQVFPSTTHVIKTIFNGGVTLDGVTSLQPSGAVARSLFALRVGPQPLYASAVLGLADLGKETDAPPGDTYVQDGDNNLDVCLELDTATAAALLRGEGSIAATCSAPLGTQLFPPKGRYPCVPGHWLPIAGGPGGSSGGGVTPPADV